MFALPVSAKITTIATSSTRFKDWSNVDPVGTVRLACKLCDCSGYVLGLFSANTGNKGRCRRCGCSFRSHVAGQDAGVETAQSLAESASQWCSANQKDSVEPLPQEAERWEATVSFEIPLKRNQY